MPLRLMVVLSFCAASFAASARMIVIEADDGHKLVGDLYAVAKPVGGVLLVHQCNGDRHHYAALGQALAKVGLVAMALDSRGFGDSRSDAFDVPKLKTATASEAEFARGFAPIRKLWGGDLRLALTRLRLEAGDGNKNRIALVGASCGGRAALLAASKDVPRALALLSAVADAEVIDAAMPKLAATPVLTLAGTRDAEFAAMARSVFDASKHPQSELIWRNSERHGTLLFDEDAALLAHVVAWISARLSE